VEFDSESRFIWRHPVQYRVLGKTGQSLSVIGFGAMLVRDVSTAEASKLVQRGLDAGINYFDVAPSYGNAQDMLGPALEPYRSNVFLACKTTKRDAAAARAELENSLRVLRTDHFDLYQLHAMTTMAEVEQVFGPGGAMETFEQARSEGKARLLGFSAHSAEVAVELLRRYPFASVLTPINFGIYLKGHFGPQIVEACQRAGAGLLALKSMAWTKLPEGTAREQRHWTKCWYEPITDPEIARLALRFTLSLPVTAAITPGHPELWEMALPVGEEVQPLTPAERERLLRLAEQIDPLFRAA
jgi:aryl-alcohol dehydrogenase-like predicted oxidoreductase